jgi:hypothetical protein
MFVSRASAPPFELPLEAVQSAWNLIKAWVPDLCVCCVWKRA